MYSQFILNIFSIIPLLFTITLAKKHILQSRKNVYYIVAAVITIILLLLEIFVTVVATQSDIKFVIWHKLTNILGFSLSPIVPYVILQFISGDNKTYGSRSLWILPLYANIILCIASFWSGFIFTVDSQNQYFREDFFFIPTFVSMIFFLIILYEFFKNRTNVAKTDRMMLFMVFLLPVASTAFQIAFPSMLVIWPSIAMSLLLYYIHTLEVQFDFDIQTQIENRSAFEKHLKVHENRKNVTLFVFDLNDLKKTNDLYGHETGDKLIKTAANILSKHFEGVGEVFRIGGDEFCAVCPVLTSEEATVILEMLTDEIDKAHFSLPIKLSMAFGLSQYDMLVDISISTALSRADDAMYAHKFLHKKH